MRSAVVQLPVSRTESERRQVLRAAIRQLERADIYLAAIAYMDLDDSQAERTVTRVRTDVESLRRYLVARRAARE
jgi:plasmid stability protein